VKALQRLGNGAYAMLATVGITRDKFDTENGKIKTKNRRNFSVNLK
jgi:hypothetical protein